MPELACVECASSREDVTPILVADNDVDVGKMDCEPSVADWPNANERLPESWHDVSRPREVGWEVGDAMLGRCAGELVLARCSADGDGWRGGIIVLHLRVVGEVDRRCASVGNASSRLAGAAIGDLALPFSCHLVLGGAIEWEVGRLRGDYN